HEPDLLFLSGKARRADLGRGSDVYVANGHRQAARKWQIQPGSGGRRADDDGTLGIWGTSLANNQWSVAGWGSGQGLMQGIIVTPGGDIWALGVSKNQLPFFPGGDYTNERIVCEGRDVEPCKSLAGPFRLEIDQQNRIWVTNASEGTLPG